MKQVKLSIAMLLAVGISFQSCKKDDVEKEPVVQEQPVTDSTNNTPIKITPEQVEGYKADVEDAGMKLVGELDGLAATKAATSVGIANKKGASPLKSSNPFSALAYTDTKSMASALKSSSESIADGFAQETGIYTWNPSTSNWDKEAATGKVVYKFPSTETGTTNNAEIAITEFAATANSLTETGDAPSKIVAYIKVDGAEVATYAFTASYNADGIPSNISTTLTVESYALTVSGTFSSSIMTEKFAFTNGGTTILGWNTTANGDFSKAKVEEVSGIQASGDFTVVGQLLSSLETSYQIFDIELSMDADTKAIANSINTINTSDKTDEEKSNEMVKVINDNLNMTLAYTDGTLIANTELVIVRETLNANTEYVEVYETYSMDFIFADNSRVAVDTYMTESMSGVQTAIDKLLADLDAKY